MQILLTQAKLDALIALLISVRHLPGSVAELGVYQGGTLSRMARAVPEKTFHGFDTFTGQPAESWREIDFHLPGEFGDTSYADVAAAMPANVTLHRGLFPGTAEFVREKFCFAHVDFDLEKSTDDAIAWLVPRMTSGGIVVFDDYKWRNCKGIEPAIRNAHLDVTESAPFQCFWVAP